MQPDRMQDELVLALDQGGQSSRALVFDAHGAVVARAARAVGEARPAPDQVEQDPEELVRSLAECVAEVAELLGTDVGRIACAGLATQRSSSACWDRTNGQALAPVHSWQDRRAARWLEGFDARQDEIVQRTGLRLSPHYGASKLRWCLDELRDVRQARTSGRLVLGPLASFLAHRLVAERPLVADPANASRTLLWNLARGDWDDELCALFGVPRELLPTCVPTRHPFGTLRVGPRAVPFTVLNGDQSCALFAWGAPDPDVLHVNLGTGAFVQRAVHGDPPEVEGLLRSVVLGERERRTCVLEGTINGAGSALSGVARELGLAAHEQRLDGWIATQTDLPLFLNGVSGLAAPFWRSDFRTRFVGTGTREAHLVAVAESIAFLARAIADAMSTKLPPPRSARASGGLSRSDAFCQRLADALELPVVRREEPEATARGLATLLGASTGATSTAEALERFEPLPLPAFARRRADWRAALDAALSERPS